MPKKNITLVLQPLEVSQIHLTVTKEQRVYNVYTSHGEYKEIKADLAYLAAKESGIEEPYKIERALLEITVIDNDLIKSIGKTEIIGTIPTDELEN
jgi:hypothetical protein